MENPSTVEFAAHIRPAVEVQIRESRPDTKDKIFMLSWKEAEQYYGKGLRNESVLGRRPSSAVLQKRKTLFTELLIGKFSDSSSNTLSLVDGTERLSWMLRSTGYDGINCILVIGYDGKRSQDKASYNGVRPAMWVNVGD